MPITISKAIMDSGNHIDFTDHINSSVYIPDTENLLLEIFLHFLCQLQTEISKLNWHVGAILDFFGHIEILWSYKYWNWNPQPWKPTIRHVSSLSLTIIDRDCKFIEFWPPYWILGAILNFQGHMIIEIEFLYPNNLLLDIFHNFLCQ